LHFYICNFFTLTKQSKSHKRFTNHKFCRKA
jgi:hypothetical protein